MFVFNLLTTTGFSQIKLNAQPQLFANYASKINCTAIELNSFFTTTEGEEIRIIFQNSLNCKGIVKSNVLKYKNFQALTIKLPEFNNAVFALSKRLDGNNNIIYCGRIINQQNEDGYELKHLDENNYQLIKFNFADILQLCAAK
jgi:hypothetical protein